MVVFSKLFFDNLKMEAKVLLRISLFVIIEISFSKIAHSKEKMILEKSKSFFKEENIYCFAQCEKFSGLGILKPSMKEKKKKEFLNSLCTVNLKKLTSNSKYNFIMNNGIIYNNSINKNLMEKKSFF